ncbi:MAG: ABC transporter ATP-binding protein [Litorilinea sp.]
MIQVHDLVFQYDGTSAANSVPAVRNISFDIAEGEIFGFLGPSGAGKSTTQKILIGLLKNYTGEIAVLGKDLQAWGSDYYEQVGVGFELPNHYQRLTGLENLNLFRALYRGPTRDPQELLDLVGLGPDANTRVSAYSKGMQMRLNFVRAILHNPRLLFLDEPTAGLDPVNGRRMKDLILDLRRDGCTVFLTTHDMMVADELCDRVAFIVDGQIALIDSPRALKLRNGQHLVRVEYRTAESAAAATTADFPLEGVGSNAEFLDLIRTHQVETIHSLEASLEHIFIQVTGRKLQ